MKKMKRLVIAIMTLLVLAACSQPPEMKNEDLVEHIQFDEDNHVIVDTKRIVFAIRKKQIEFVETPNGELTLHENENNNLTVFQEFWPYTLFIPTDQVKELSRQYAAAYNETLPIQKQDVEK